MKYTAGLLIGCALLSACAGGETLSPQALAGASLPPPDVPTLDPSQEYRINPNDIVEVTVLEASTLNRTGQVDLSGNINLPMLGDVPAKGKTAGELRVDIANRLKQKYLNDPQVSVAVKESKINKFTVDGSVTQPGVFPMNGNTSLLQAIASAKGTDQVANPRQVVVFRVVNNQRVAGVFDLSQIRAGKAPDPAIYPNDVIVVASSQARRTLRDIIGVTPIVPLLLIP